MSEVSAIQTQIQNLESELEVLRDRLKFAQEKEQMLACFRAALLTEYKAGDVTDVGFNRIVSAIGAEALKEDEYEAVQEIEKEPDQAA